MLFQNTPNGEKMVFSSVSNDRNSAWAAILEKAWAKVRGNYIIADGGFPVNALHTLLGVPVYEYFTRDITTQ
jgi:hypothetical protein